MINNKRQLQMEYEELSEKYNKLYSECSQVKYELSELKGNAENINRQDEEIRKLHNKMRALKHDMKNHLMVIASYLNSEDIVAAKTYISEILDKLNSIHSYIETGNTLLNHILNEKLELARKNGIQVKAEIENLSFERMESLDFSALLTNILDNAIEASGKEANPELFVSISKRRDYEVIMVKNKISKSVLASNPTLETTKSNHLDHGRGVSQIKSITEKYDGMCDFYEEDGFFLVCAFIPE